jgi:hypothetical protein
MLVYAVMCNNWDGECDVISVEDLYADMTVAEEFVKTAMLGLVDEYSPRYWVVGMVVKA